MKRLVVTGDDFGLAIPVNEAIEKAHREGILTSASLMVGAEAAADAIERARRLPQLHVGLHVVLVRGRSILPPDVIPALVGADGRFPTNLVRAGVAVFFRPDARRQLEAEIRAQFEAYVRTGLPLGHVDAHNHMHVHPTVLRLILEVGRDYGLEAVRWPREPAFASWRAARRGLAPRLASRLLLAPWLGLARKRLARAGMRRNDWVLGMTDTGRMTESLVLAQLAALPEGETDMYFHPACRRWEGMDPLLRPYAMEGELEALTSKLVARSVDAHGIERGRLGGGR